MAGLTTATGLEYPSEGFLPLSPAL